MWILKSLPPSKPISARVLLSGIFSKKKKKNVYVDMAFIFDLTFVSSQSQFKFYYYLLFVSISFSQSRSIAQAFSSSVFAEFETATMGELRGMEGDVVVTVGMTVLISDAFQQSFKSSGSVCTIEQSYTSQWEPSKEVRMDTLQVTPRASLRRCAFVFLFSIALCDCD